MSSSAAPISIERFASAITALPLANLHIKAAELRNSMFHLRSSNTQLQTFADEGDRDCAQAIEDNQVTLYRIYAQIRLLRKEVETRGFMWDEISGRENNEVIDVDNEIQPARELSDRQGLGQDASTGSGLGDEELARGLSARLREHVEEQEAGVHL